MSRLAAWWQWQMEGQRFRGFARVKHIILQRSTMPSSFAQRIHTIHMCSPGTLDAYVAQLMKPLLLTSPLPELHKAVMLMELAW